MAENSNHYSRRTPQDRSLRASDRDRDAVGDLLRRQHVAGRLNTDEFAERFGRCLEAKTYAQLDELIVDLPADAEAAFEAGPAPWTGGAWRAAGPRWAGRRPWRIPVFAWVVLVVALAAVSGGRLLWLAFPLFFFFVLRPLMWHSTWRSAGRGPGWGRRGCWGHWA